MEILTEIGHALWIAFAMFWEILWPLILGFGLSGVVQAVTPQIRLAVLHSEQVYKKRVAYVERLIEFCKNQGVIYVSLVGFRFSSNIFFTSASHILSS